jgi:hypothetical protein
MKEKSSRDRLQRTPGEVLSLELEARARVWRKGLFLAVFLRALALFLAGMIGLGLLDFFLPIQDGLRAFLMGGLLLAVIAWMVWKGRAIWRLGHEAMADHADQLLNDGRRSFRSAWELQSGKFAERAGSGSSFLVEKAVVDSHLGFYSLKPESCRPTAAVRRGGYWMLGVMGVVIFLAVLNMRAVSVIGGRLLNPGADIPPYSPLKFTLHPDEATVLYGGNLEVEATIEGGEVRGPVTLMTRIDGKVQAVECFRGNAGRFSQKIENVVAPLEFCFQAGRARSKWHRIDLRLDPQFSVARLRLNFPEYTGEPLREWLAGSEELKVLRGTSATMAATSNRPLAGGTIRFVPDAADGQERMIRGEVTGMHTVQFAWEMLESGTVEVSLTDVTGSKSTQPLVLKQTVRPDEKPQVSIHEPGPFSLATPNTVLPIVGSASDDYGLKRVDLVRSSPGFRDRILPTGPDVPSRNVAVNETLKMAELGVKPGEVLEFYVEGRDSNPSLTGIQSSEVVRVEIISEEDYGKMIRDRTSLEEFSARFQAVQEALDRMEGTLEEALAAKESGDAEKVNEALEAARKAAETGESLLKRLSEDFPAFDLEKAMQGPLANSAKMMEAMRGALAGLNADSPELQPKLEELLAESREKGDEMRGVTSTAEEVAKMGRLMELGQKFAALIQEQQEVVRQMDRLRSPGQRDPTRLRMLGEREGVLAGQVGELAEQIRQAADEAERVPELGKLAEDARNFAGALQGSGAAGLMQESERGTVNDRGTLAHQRAQEGLERLEALLPQPGGPGSCSFTGLCRGFLPQRVPAGTEETLGQLMQGMMARRGSGSGGGGGAGMSGEDGYAVASYSRMNLPIFGPNRTVMMPQASAGLSSTGSAGEAGSGDGLLRRGDQESLEARADRAQDGGSLDRQKIPEKYREAVRRYFESKNRP